jgi:Protein of unknown function (DUF1275)
MKGFRLAALLSFNGGFVDTAGFLGLQGLFTAHVTGNFVTLAAALVLGTHGVVVKLLALPEFVRERCGVLSGSRGAAPLRPCCTSGSASGVWRCRSSSAPQPPSYTSTTKVLRRGKWHAPRHGDFLARPRAISTPIRAYLGSASSIRP